MPAKLRGGPTPNYRVNVDVLEPARGRKIGGFSFDWYESTQSRMIKRYAEQISRKFIEQFAAWYGDGERPARPYTVRLLGVPDAGSLVQYKQAIEKLEGVKSVNDRGFSAGKDATVATLRVLYTGGPLELVYAMQTAGKDLGLAFEAADAASGTLTLQVGAAPPEKQADAAPKGDGVAAGVLLVGVESAKSQREVLAIMNAVRDRVPGVQSVEFDAYENGRGAFTIRHQGDAAAVIAAFKEKAGALPVEVAEADAERGTLRVRVRAGL